MNLEEFATKISFTGEWVISYHDASHLQPLVRDQRDREKFGLDRLKRTVILGKTVIDDVSPDVMEQTIYYGGKEPADKEARDILKDRMILEGVKRIIKEKSTAEKIYLLSGDIDMVRFAKLENVEAIYAGKRQLEGGEQFYSAHYDIYKRGFVACGVHEFLWDLTHVFSFIKADNPTAKRTITLDYYFAGKNVKDWEEDVLEVMEQEYEPAI